MKVIDLIANLTNMDPNMEVLFDSTGPDAEVFKFVSVDTVDEIETEEGTSYVLLSCGVELPRISEN